MPNWRQRAESAEDQVLKLVAMNQELQRESEQFRACMTDERGQSVRELLRRADALLLELGWRRCDAAACNCGSWHQDPCVDWKAMYEKERDALFRACEALVRLDEIFEVSTKGAGTETDDGWLEQVLWDAAGALGERLPETMEEVAASEGES